jgi:nicotinamide riboside kinase
VVISDTTALMVAIYSAMLFEDGSLYRFALECLHRYDRILVTGLDLPWVPDGLQRDGPHVREPVDALIRQALARADVPYHVVYGRGTERLGAALAALGSMKPAPHGHAAEAHAPSRSAMWRCAHCGDPDCEHRLFTGRL